MPIYIQAFYTLEVPAGATDPAFVLSGGAGDAALYVRFGDVASTSAFECRSWEIGNIEECLFPTPQADTYHVMVHAYGSYSGVDLLGSFTDSDSLILSDGFESGDVLLLSDSIGRYSGRSQ